VFNRKENTYPVWLKMTYAPILSFKIICSVRIRYVFVAIVLDDCNLWEWEKARLREALWGRQVEKWLFFLEHEYSHRASKIYWLCCLRFAVVFFSPSSEIPG
jgi:hypothetical protein